jgi:hypothetical protein
MEDGIVDPVISSTIWTYNLIIFISEIDIHTGLMYFTIGSILCNINIVPLKMSLG